MVPWYFMFLTATLGFGCEVYPMGSILFVVSFQLKYSQCSGEVKLWES